MFLYRGFHRYSTLATTGMVARERMEVRKVPWAITVSSTPYLRQKMVPNEATGMAMMSVLMRTMEGSKTTVAAGMSRTMSWNTAKTSSGMSSSRQKLVAFALETNNEVHNAEEKLRKKNADLIVLNSTRIPDTTFGSDNNQIAIITRDGHRRNFPKKSKTEVAKDIVDCL